MLLSSPNDGEIVAAAGKLNILLRKHERDWHDVCDHLIADVVAPLSQSPTLQPASDWAAGTGGRQIDAAQLIGIIEAIRKSRIWLSASSRELLNGLECR